MKSSLLHCHPWRLIDRIPSSMVAAGGLATASAINLAAFLLWVRWLGPDEFGTLALIAATGLLANALAFEWLRLAGARTLIVDGEVAPSVLSDWIRATAITAIALSALAPIATAFGMTPMAIEPRWNAAIVLLAVGEMVIGAVALVARLELRPWRFAAILVGRAVLSIVGSIFALAVGSGVTGVIAVLIAAPLIVALSVVARDPLWREALSRKPTGVRALLSLGAPLIPASILQLAASLADRLLVGILLGAGAVGVFAAPADLVARTLGFAMMALNLSAYPMLVRLFDGGDRAEASRALRRNGLTLLAMGVPMAALLILLASPLTSNLLGPAYAPAASLLPWLAGAALLRLLAVFHYGVRFQLERQMILLLPGPTVALVVLLAGAQVAISTEGLLGLAKLGFAAQAAGLLVSAILARNRFRQ